MISAKADQIGRVVGPDLGANDYIASRSTCARFNTGVTIAQMEHACRGDVNGEKSAGSRPELTFI